jgi:hypothetical protein
MFRVTIFFLSVLVLNIIIYPLVHGNLLSPTDLAVGKWDIKISRRDKLLFERMIFPSYSKSGEWFREDPYWRKFINSSNEEDMIKLRKEIRPKRYLSRLKRLDCELLLYQDGSFFLKPKHCLQSDDGTELAPPGLLRGWWSLRPNPYCVTDRQYDELTLISYPKVRKYASRANNKTGELTIPFIQKREEIIIELNCKVWGRYGSNAIRKVMNLKQGRDAGRMTHGIITIIKHLLDSDHQQNGERSSSKQQRVVCATFYGKAG